METVQIQGHRGARGEYPENTLIGIEHALGLRVDGVEVDVAITQDQEAILFHDEFLEGRRLSEWTLKELRKRKLGLSLDPKFPEQKLVEQQIPTLKETLEVFQKDKGKTILNLELKYYEDEAFSVCDYWNILKKVLNSFPNLYSKIIFHSFSIALLKERENHPFFSRFATGLLVENKLDELRCIELKKELALSFISPESCLLEKSEQIDLFHKEGLKVFTWTVNSPKEWERMLKIGVDGMITDFPSRFRKEKCYNE